MQSSSHNNEHTNGFKTGLFYAKPNFSRVLSKEYFSSSRLCLAEQVESLALSKMARRSSNIKVMKQVSYAFSGEHVIIPLFLKRCWSTYKSKHNFKTFFLKRRRAEQLCTKLSTPLNHELANNLSRNTNTDFILQWTYKTYEAKPSSALRLTDENIAKPLTTFLDT